jgi:hypothetical protein
VQLEEMQRLRHLNNTLTAHTQEAVTAKTKAEQVGTQGDWEHEAVGSAALLFLSTRWHV